jgi:hypothetical protein
MKRGVIPVLARETLTNMPTKQSLGRLRSLHRCEESAALSDWTPEEVATCEGILFKNTAEWQRAYTDLKVVLATRQHVPSAAERARARQQRATGKSNKRVGGSAGTPRLWRAGRSRSAAPHHAP